METKQHTPSQFIETVTPDSILEVTPVGWTSSIPATTPSELASLDDLQDLAEDIVRYCPGLTAFLLNEYSPNNPVTKHLRSCN